MGLALYVLVIIFPQCYNYKREQTHAKIQLFKFTGISLYLFKSKYFYLHLWWPSTMWSSCVQHVQAWPCSWRCNRELPSFCKGLAERGRAEKEIQTILFQLVAMKTLVSRKCLLSFKRSFNDQNISVNI